MRFVVALVVITSCSFVRAAPLAPPVTHLERGIKLFDTGELDGALTELEAAYALDPSADACYALGQVLRKKGQCDRAIRYFRCAVSQSPSEAFTRAAQYQIGRCVVEQPGSMQAPISTADAVATKPTATLEAQPRRRAWWRDPAGGALTGIGLASAIAGAALLGRAQVLASDSSSGLEAFHAAGAVPGLRIAGDVTLAAGGVLLIGAIVRYALVSRR